MRIFLFILSCTFWAGAVWAEGEEPDKKVLIALLARNVGHYLPQYLQCIENLDYNKELITLYVNTNNNADDTREVLLSWIKKNKEHYHAICFESSEYDGELSIGHSTWDSTRLTHLAAIRNRSLEKAKEYNVDYYFVADCDNFIMPFTLKELIKKDKPIISPLLKCIPEKNDTGTNFFCTTAENGYFVTQPQEFWDILNRVQIGTFKVQLVHCCYLIKAEYLDKLGYSEGTGEWEYIVFSRFANRNGVEQYICNEKEFGTHVHYFAQMTLEEEKEKLPLLGNLCERIR